MSLPSWLSLGSLYDLGVSVANKENTSVDLIHFLKAKFEYELRLAHNQLHWLLTLKASASIATNHSEDNYKI